jgi:arginyl-tRNA synthetase
LNKNINKYIIKIVKEAVQKCITDHTFTLQEIPPIILTTTKNPEHGHLTTNLALQLSGIIKSNPRKIAERIVQEIEKNKKQVITKIEVAGPGFINFYLKNTVLHSVLREIMQQKSQFGNSDIGRNKKINIEFVSVNPTGPLHVGHGKCAAVGDALAKILNAAGYQVKTEYYINDHGKQIDTLGASVLARYRSFFDEQVEFPENGYQGEYIISLAKEIKSKYGDRYIKGNVKENIEFFKEYAQNSILQDIKDDLNSFGVRFDNWFSERSLYDKNKVQSVIEKLLEEKHVYQHEGALWFRASDFGDEKDRVVIRENGEPTYFASDIAYHDDKFKRGFNTLIDIWGADHHGYIKRMKAAIKAMGYDPDSFQVLLVQFVTLIKEGQAIGMSTRGGEFITLRDLLQEVGSDVARYFFLMHSHDSHTEFDLDVAKSQSMENPVFYIQYAYARICSIIEKGRINNIILDDEIEKEIDLSLLDKYEELELIKKLANFRKAIENSALHWKPHLVASYLHELAAQFHKYYTEYKVLGRERGLSEARLYLVFCIKIVLENALSLLGIKAPEQM